MVFNKLRSLLSHSRLPLRISSMSPRPKVYRVRIRTAERSSMLLPFVSAASLFLATKLALGDNEKTIFIPLTMSKTVPQPPYTREDPVVHTYTSFSQDYELQREVQKRLANATVKSFEKYREKFGNNMRCSIVWLWFQYPSGPPPKYEQSGLAITRNSIQWTSREIHPFHYYRYMVAVWPEWMFNSLKASFLRVVTTIKDEINTALDEEEEVDSKGNKITPIFTIPHPELTGKVAFDETVGNFRDMLRQTPPKNAPAPPKGHVRVTGIVQIIGDKMLVNADVDATFDPTTCDKFSFNYIKIRYVVFSAKIRTGIQNVQKIQRQAVADALRPPAVSMKEGEGLLEGAKAVIQEAARKARVQSGEPTSGAESSVTAIRKAQDAELVEAQGVKKEKNQVTPAGHAPLTAPPEQKTDTVVTPERERELQDMPALSVDEIGRKPPQHDGSADRYPEHPPSSSKPESD